MITLKNINSQPGAPMTLQQHLVRSALGLNSADVKYVDIHGILPSTLKTTDRLVWPLVANYTPYTAVKTLAVSSTSAADTSKAIDIEYLDGSYELKTATIYTDAVDGQLKKTSAVTDCLRVLSAVVKATSFAGNIYIFDNADSVGVGTGIPATLTTVARYILNGCGADASCFYTIPAGYIGLMGWSRGAIESTGTAPTDNEGANFCVRSTIVDATLGRLRYRSLAYLTAGQTGNAVDNHNFEYAYALPEKTDIFINHVKSTADALQVSAALSIALVKIASIVQ